jgi:SulP family sulfate permease
LSAAVSSARWWRSFGERGGIARGDLAGGFTAALVLPAIEGSYGLVAFAPLGPAHAQTGFLLGACTAAVATLMAFASGARGPLLAGSSAALALLLASLIEWLIADPRFLGTDGQPMLPLVLAFTGLAVVVAGLLQLLLARTHLGALVRYVPYPVHAGYMNGVAVLMVGTILPYLLGMSSLQTRISWDAVKPAGLLIGVVALAIAIRPPAVTRRVPAYLTGLLVATLLHHLLAATPLAAWLGPLFDAPQFRWPGLDTLAPVQHELRSGLLLDMALPLTLFALLVATMSTLQTALSGSTIDEMTRTRRDPRRELLAQGLANVGTGLIGALPAAGSTMRSKINLDAGGRTRMSRLAFGAALLLVLAIGLRFMHVVPMAAIAGVFCAVAYSLVDDWTRRATAVLWVQSFKQRVPRQLMANYAVMLLVAAVTVFVSLALAIVLGSLVAMVLFIRANIKPPVRRVLDGAQRPSRKLRPPAAAAALRRHGGRIALVELDGALFFGTAEAADDAIERLAAAAQFIVLDFARVREIDASGARVLLHAAGAVRRGGRTLLLAGLAPRDARTRMLRDMDVHATLSDAQFFADADRALEAAEDRLLAQVAPDSVDPAPLALAATRLGEGLDDDELATLAACLHERTLAPGDRVFSRGEPSDALYVSLQGQIGIWLPAAAGAGAAQRLVSYAPGVVFGEIGLLESQPRSADALAEAATRLLVLPREAFDELTRTRPALVAKLLRNIGLQLSSRVRALTDELRADDLPPTPSRHP